MTSDDPAPGGIGTRRSARSKRTTASSSGSSSSRAAKLAALREARQSGRGTLDMYEVRLVSSLLFLHDFMSKST